MKYCKNIVPPPVSILRDTINRMCREGFSVVMTVKPSRFFCAHV